MVCICAREYTLKINIFYYESVKNSSKFTIIYLLGANALRIIPVLWS